MSSINRILAKDIEMLRLLRIFDALVDVLKVPSIPASLGNPDLFSVSFSGDVGL